jgi:hypothetical protein
VNGEQIESWVTENMTKLEWCMMVARPDCIHWLAVADHGAIEMFTGEIKDEELKKL